MSIAATSPTTGEVERTDPACGPEAVDAGRSATEALGPEGKLLAGIDVAGFAQSLSRVMAALAARPHLLLGPTGRLTVALATGGASTAGRFFGVPFPGVDGDDRRFRHQAWEHNPWYFGIRQSYAAWSRYLLDLVDAAGVDRLTAEKARFAVQLAVGAMAPTNTFWGNPAAIQRAAETGGMSVLAGVRNFFHDLSVNGGRPSQVDATPFRLGENLAATPGTVVFKNDLMELIQYEAQTDTVHEVPLLLSPPWINKYYIMDLSPGRSFVEWAVQHGHTVFAISYRNPDESHRDVNLDDYLLNGPYEALRVIEEITGSKQANVVGLCLGGTLTMMLLAHLAAHDHDRVRSATLLNTMIDFREPGPMGIFVDPRSVEQLSERMQERGFLESSEMSTMFDLLRAQDLVWNYVGTGWLMGEKPPAFDILAWNADGTRMPADMHSFYLRYCYVENQLAKGEMTLAGTRLDLRTIDEDVYVLAARDDHIAPWKSSYATTHLTGGPVRFVLSSSGHVAGIVNPPGGRRSYWTNADLPPDPEQWLAGAEHHQGSWWEDWTAWIAERAGKRRQPPPMGSKAHPPLGPAPGTYVHQR
ncbi:MAG TPA: alpha/beta fold hydrolase [Acidimicrobiales bacterium]|nr:alpha/beta fold hydrolase [Acidimicrobiales bacterium]